MKVSIFKLKKNRRFNYTPRYFKGKDQGNLYDFDSKFSKYRDTYNKNDLANPYQHLLKDEKPQGKMLYDFNSNDPISAEQKHGIMTYDNDYQSRYDQPGV